MRLGGVFFFVFDLPEDRPDLEILVKGIVQFELKPWSTPQLEGKPTSC